MARTRNQQILAPKTATDLFQYIPTGLDEALPTPHRRVCCDAFVIATRSRAAGFLSCAFFGLMILTVERLSIEQSRLSYLLLSIAIQLARGRKVLTVLASRTEARVSRVCTRNACNKVHSLYCVHS